jgi:hypothetical protein
VAGDQQSHDDREHDDAGRREGIRRGQLGKPPDRPDGPVLGHRREPLAVIAYGLWRLGVRLTVMRWVLGK